MAHSSSVKHETSWSILDTKEKLLSMLLFPIEMFLGAGIGLVITLVLWLGLHWLIGGSALG